MFYFIFSLIKLKNQFEQSILFYISISNNINVIELKIRKRVCVLITTNTGRLIYYINLVSRFTHPLQKI